MSTGKYTADANNLMAKYRISGVPITEGRKLVGIITNRDLMFEEDFSKKIKESHDIGGTDYCQRRRNSVGSEKDPGKSQKREASYCR